MHDDMKSHSLIVKEARYIAQAIDKIDVLRPIEEDLIAEYLTHVLTTDHRRRTLVEGEKGLRMLRRPRKGDNVGAVLIERINWHTGRTNASLWGPMIGLNRVPSETFDDLDTIATIIAFRLGKLDLSASCKWARALGSAS